MTKPKPFELPELISFEGVNHGIFRGALHAEFLRTQYDLGSVLKPSCKPILLSA